MRRNTDAKPETACVYFGPDRLKRMKARAKSLGQSLSTFVCISVDAGLELGRERIARLEAMASLRGVTPSELLGQLIDGATKEAISKAAN